jgi:hypothetical protein
VIIEPDIVTSPGYVNPGLGANVNIGSVPPGHGVVGDQFICKSIGIIFNLNYTWQ